MRRRQFRTRFFFHFTLFLAGGFLYGLTEVLFRGYTHWSMFLLGGVCVLGIGTLRRSLRGPLPEKMLLSGMMITGAELLCGLCVNRICGLCVWDYSAVPLNLWGQICVPFSSAWCLLSLPAMGLDALHCRLVWKQEPVRKKVPVSAGAGTDTAHLGELGKEDAVLSLQSR